MKSTLKIDFQSRNNAGVPVIKIVQPISVLNQNAEDDVDPKDTLINVFLHNPSNLRRNHLFSLSSYYPTPFDNPTHYITNIEPITNEVLFYRLRMFTANTLKDWGVDFDEKKIFKLFDEIDEKLKSHSYDIPTPSEGS